jgi:hypothetical protein
MIDQTPCGLGVCESYNHSPTAEAPSFPVLHPEEKAMERFLTQIPSVHRDGERSAVLYPNSLYFDIGGMVCDCTDDLE